MRKTSGGLLIAVFRPDRTAELVQRLREAGTLAASIVGQITTETGTIEVLDPLTGRSPHHDRRQSMAARWDPFRDAMSLREAMDRLLEQSIINPRGGATPRGTLTLPIDLWETTDSLVARVAACQAVKPRAGRHRRQRQTS